jgi:hypothetical protein
MTDQQQKIYICKLMKIFILINNLVCLFLVQIQIEELTRRLKMSDLGISSNPEAR